MWGGWLVDEHVGTYSGITEEGVISFSKDRLNLRSHLWPLSYTAAISKERLFGLRHELIPYQSVPGFGSNSKYGYEFV